MSYTTGYTPAPWRFDEWTLYGAVPNCGNNGERYIMANDRRVALVDSRIERKRGKNATPFDAPDDERDANARLIAAAPDLLAALEAMLEAVKGAGVLNHKSYDALGIQVNDAIKKARGA